MERTRFIEHRGRRILLLDYTNAADPDYAVAEIRKSREFIARQPRDGSLLTLTNTTGSVYDKRILEALKDLALHNKPYVKSAAVVTDSAFHRAAISMVALFTRRELRGFDDLEKAMDWLATQ